MIIRKFDVDSEFVAYLVDEIGKEELLSAGGIIKGQDSGKYIVWVRKDNELMKPKKEEKECLKNTIS